MRPNQIKALCREARRHLRDIEARTTLRYHREFAAMSLRDLRACIRALDGALGDEIVGDVEWLDDVAREEVAS